MNNSSERRDKRRAKRNRTRIKRAVAAVAVLGVLGGSGAFLFNNLTSQLKTVDTSQYIQAENRPEKVKPVTYTTPVDGFDGPLNILLIGSDTRNDPGEGIEGMRSDTTILAHISADRKRVDMVSIPRDSLVDIPSCTLPDGSVTPDDYGKFNGAFAYGGETGDTGAAASCAIKTFEQASGLYVDGFAVIDFSGFEKVVDSIGGVEFTVDEEINDPSFNNLTIPAGVQVFDGETALNYARVRKAEGMDGSDLSRIDRQQELLSAIVDKTKTKISDVPAMYSLVGSLAGMTTTSKELGDVSKLAGLAWSLQKTGDEAVKFTTVPVVDAGDGANVLWSEDATLLWDNIAQDLPLPGAENVAEEVYSPAESSPGYVSPANRIVKPY